MGPWFLGNTVVGSDGHSIRTERTDGRLLIDWSGIGEGLRNNRTGDLQLRSSTRSEEEIVNIQNEKKGLQPELFIPRLVVRV